MVRKIIIALLMALAPVIAMAQTTTVTGAVTDANGNPYFPGTVSAFINLGSGQPLPPGVPASGSIGPFPTTAGGNFVVIVASPFSWSFTICGTPPDIGPKGNPTPKQVCFTTPAIAISGLSQSITGSLGPIPLLGPGGGTGGAIASVFGRTGIVVATQNDYNFNQLAGSMACSQRPALVGDTTSPAGSCTTTTSRLNGVSLAGLGTGPLKNNTLTGTPSISVSSDIFGLWGGICDNTTALFGDGQCRVPTGTGTVTHTAGGLTANNFTFGNGAADIKDAGFSVVPPSNGGSGVANPSAHGVAIAEGGSNFNFACISALTGQLLTANNAADLTCNSPGLGGGDVNAGTYTVRCDSGTTLLDRVHILRFITTAPTVTMPDPTASGCGANFVVGLIASGVTVTVNRTATAVFNIYNGSAPVLAATTFNLTTGQYATLSSSDNANWTVRVVSGGIGNPTFDRTATGLLNPVADSTFTQPITSVSGWSLTGTAPASVSTATGTAATTLFNVLGVAGGADSNATGTGGVGSSPSITAGTGGAGTGTNTVGGAGGGISLTAGNGGASAGSGANSNGGNVTVTPGTAGTGGSGAVGKQGTFGVLGAGAGFLYLSQGTIPTTLNTNIPANSIIHTAPVAVTPYTDTDAGVAAQGLRVGTLNGSVITNGYSGDSNHSATVTIGSGTSIGSTSLCSTGNCPVGTYRVNVYVDITTACGTSGTYVINLIYTDDQGSKTIPVNIGGTGAVPATGVLTTTSTANFGQNAQIIRSTGAASINYSTTAVACGTAGPMVGKLYLSVEPIQ